MIENKSTISKAVINKKKQKDCILTSGGDRIAAQSNKKKWRYLRFSNIKKVLWG